MAGAIHSTGKKDYTTPEWILTAVRNFFRDIRDSDEKTDRGIDLDPCSNAQSTVDAHLNLMLAEEQIWNPDTKQVEIVKNSCLDAQINYALRVVGKAVEAVERTVFAPSGMPETIPVTPRIAWEFADGLMADWGGLRIYFNPPFGYNKITRVGVADWINKAIEEATVTRLVTERVPEIIGCLPDTPETKPWKNGVLLTAQGRCQLARRVKFGGMKTGIPKPISLVYWGRYPQIFKEHFRQFGRVENPSEVYKDQAHIYL